MKSIPHRYIRDKNITDKEKKLLSAKIKGKPFDDGMYAFIMFMINYYARVKEQLKIDYDSFIVVQVVTSHSLYILNKSTYGDKLSYPDIKNKWKKITSEHDDNQSALEVVEEGQNSENLKYLKDSKLTISSICLVANLPKETVRRKVSELAKKKIISVSNKYGIRIGEDYKKIYSEFLPTTTFEVIKLLRKWEKVGVLKILLEFQFKS